MKLVIKDSYTGRYYCGNNPRLPMMGGSRATATRFDSRMDAVDAMRVMPMTVLARVEECFCSDGGGFVCTACKVDAGDEEEN